MITLQGKGVYRDICAGKIFFARKRKPRVPRFLVQDREGELDRFEKARAAASRQLKDLYVQAKETVGGANAAIFEMQQMLLEDEEFCGAVRGLVRSQYVNLEYAVQAAAESFRRKLGSVEDPYIRERAEDVRDVSWRLLGILAGEHMQLRITEPCILAAEDLTPGETVQLPMEYVKGICLGGGSVYSHTAIVARSMGIPALVEAGEGLTEDWDGHWAVLDGFAGCLYIDPDPDTARALEEKRAGADRRRAALQALKGKENVTLDGRAVRLYANAGSLMDVEAALANDAGGIGLYRSEMLFLGRESAPTEEEQYRTYMQILERMGDRPVIIRTMDIGADKQVSYLNLEKEENPALGCRAIRLCLEREDLLTVQLRALYRAGLSGRLSFMYPMVAAAWELESLRAIEDRVKADLRAEGIPFAGNIPRGIMVETPAAALLSRELASMVDFFSIGTNDLIQYTLAADRLNPRLARLYHGSQEAVMRLIEMTVESAHRAGIWVGICGEMAADTALTERFIRMGIDELSVAAGVLLSVRQQIRQIRLGEGAQGQEPGGKGARP